LKQKRKKRLKAILLLITAATLIVLLLDNVAMLIYPVKYDSIVREYSREYKLDPLLVLSIIKTESNFKPDAVSVKNAMGLMQITGKTGKWGAQKLEIANYSSDMLYSPETNIRIGCWYLATLYNQFGDTDLVLAAYNAGSGNVVEWLKDSRLSSSGKSLERIPFRETEQYLKKVHNSWKIYKKLYENQF
jgi:soluble lytic murein transglycosylase